MRQVVSRQVDGKPLTETVFFLLLSLQAGPLHGYGMMKDIASLSEGRVRLTTGTLYGAIKRLFDDEWIADVAAESSRGSKTYRLTRIGRSQLAAEIQRLRQLMGAVAAREAG
ncbi:MAG: PadR family transcriptional regulator [Acidobacteria bacterium]|nr:PadR family transcriptional regulator [Acidobacteriota bacterium]